jgi:alpha-beta hydrolase superfamily lysophospholipase
VNKIGLLLICAGLTVGCGDNVIVTAPPVRSTTLQHTDVNGVATWAMVPDSYDASKPSPWIIYNHGLNQKITSIAANPPQSSFVQSLANAGFVVIASAYRNPACWGDTECAEDIANLQTLWHSQLNLAPQPFVIAESMGGIVTWNAIALGTIKPQAVVGIYPVCSLANMYTNSAFVPTIQSAYGFNSPQQYSMATATFDPLLTPPRTFAGFPILIWASYSDETVSRSKNEDPFAAAINAAGGNVTVRNSKGDHGDPTNFDAPAVISFFSSNQR